MASIRDASGMLPQRRRRRQWLRSAQPTGRSAGERGIALALALVGLSLIYLLAAGGFALALLESRISEAHRVSVEAFYAADAALRTQLARTDIPLPPQEWSYPGRGVWVEVRPLLDLPDGHRLVHYTARATTGVPGREEAARTVRLVALTAPPPELPAALVALAGVEGEGPDVRIDARVEGGEVADPSCLPDGPIAGLLVPSGSSYAWATIDGTPPVLETEGTGGGVPDWRLQWPLAFLEDGPGVTVVEPGQPVASGAGLLVAPGDLHLDGGFEWRGLVLVGGALVAAEGVRIEGGAVTGLGLLAGQTPSPSWLGPGPVEILRHGCHLAAGAAALAGPAAVPGTWSEAF